MQTVLMKKATKAILVAIAAAVQAPYLTLEGSTVHTLALPLSQVPEPGGYGGGDIPPRSARRPFREFEMLRRSLNSNDRLHTQYPYSERALIYNANRR
jgi:hypothetical protein